MTREEVIESAAPGLPDRQEIEPDSETDYYDWGWVKYNKEDRVIDMERTDVGGKSFVSVWPAWHGRIRELQRVAVVTPNIDIYLHRLVFPNRLLPGDGDKSQGMLSALLVKQLKTQFAAVITLPLGSVSSDIRPTLKQAQDRFEAAVTGSPLKPLATGASADAIGQSLAEASRGIDAEAIVLAKMTAIVQAAPNTTAAEVYPWPVAELAPEDLASDDACHHAAAPAPILFYSPIPTTPAYSPPAPPPITASLSIAMVAVDSGEILWSQVGMLDGNLQDASELTETRLQHLVDHATSGLQE